MPETKSVSVYVQFPSFCTVSYVQTHRSPLTLPSLRDRRYVYVNVSHINGQSMTGYGKESQNPECRLDSD